jgi:hypothetical protein
VTVLAAGDPGQPRRVLSLGEAKWDKVMTLQHLERLRRARDLLSVRGYVTRDASLACYSGAGFDDGLRDAARSGQDVKLIDLGDLYH